jgi:glycosyltransferase involved in cell wall biosynthesis
MVLDGWQVVAVAPPDYFRTPEQYTQCFTEQGIRYIPISMSRSGINPFSALAALCQLIQIYRRVKPARAHHFTIKAVIYGSIAAQMAGVPTIVNAITGLGYVFTNETWKARFLRTIVTRVYRWVLRRSNVRMIFENPDNQRFFVTSRLIHDQQAVLIRGAGVDTGRFAPTPEPEGEPIILLAARMLWDKGVGDLVEAGRLLREWGVPGQIVLVGGPDPGNPASISKTQLQAWHREGIAQWWGHQASSMEKVWARCHIVALPSSYGEGVPTSLIEAAACGRPIVTTDAPGCREVVREGENGFWVPVRDIKALASALRILVENPALRACMGARGREIAVSEFSREKVIRETLAVYDQPDITGASASAPDGLCEK